jgi:hypothetical protein
VRTWIAEGNAADIYHRHLSARLARQMRLASTIHRWSLASSAQPWLLHACRAWPAIMRLAASLTRVPRGLSQGLPVV